MGHRNINEDKVRIKDISLDNIQYRRGMHMYHQQYLKLNTVIYASEYTLLSTSYHAKLSLLKLIATHDTFADTVPRLTQ